MKVNGGFPTNVGNTRKATSLRYEKADSAWLFNPPALFGITDIISVKPNGNLSSLFYMIYKLLKSQC
jgi:hypothetical protein